MKEQMPLPLETRSDPKPVLPKFSPVVFYLSREWLALRYRVLERRGRRCECCGTASKDRAYQVDHVVSIAGRPDLALDEKNLQVLCNFCNTGKNTHARDHRVTTDPGRIGARSANDDWFEYASTMPPA